MTEVVQPTTPEAAQGRLTELSSNPEWGAKIDAQDPAAFSDFQNLTKVIAAGIPTTETMAVALSEFNGKKLVDQFLAGPLPSGYPDLESPAGADLASMLRGEKQISPELHRLVQNKLNELTADAGWRARFEAKDQTALRDFQLATGLLSAEVAS